ncbi:hypothetical protein EJ08DRAFT_235981 [Tothia fuscella]|uniref:LIM zinc-binding domain-containing protein n=1 Tax=Tothia fuscella TaxID=1048955 RepID=A0A9P4NR20_9PEZI|nr:hypothetical protein EJ08DRAFT_235981 [Tothia fuscella]
MHPPSLLRSKSKDRASNTTGLFMSKEQMGSYLQDLRANRPTKPTGARPPPSSFASKRQSTSNLAAAIESEISSQRASSIRSDAVDPPRCASAQSFHRKGSTVSIAKPHLGRPLVREPASAPSLDTGIDLDNLDENNPLHVPYLERGQRWLERQEAASLRKALEDMDLKKERELHTAAQAEASELVWRHQNPDAPVRNPEAPYDYREHLRKASAHQRTESWTRTAQDLQNHTSKIRSRNSSASRSTSGASKNSSAPCSRVASDSSLKVPGSPDGSPEDIQDRKAGDGAGQPRKRSVQFVEAEVKVPEKSAETKPKERGRTPSLQKFDKVGPVKKALGPEEDVKVSSIAVAARLASNTMPVNFRNPFSRVRNAKGSLSRASTAPMPETKRLDTVEIQRNPPTQTRDPQYTLNAPLPPPKLDPVTQAGAQEEVNMKDGKEIRSDDIRKATSMSLKDRSPKLPTPTMVSDKPGRPIVSFDKDWKPKEAELKLEPLPSRPVPLGNAQPYARPNINKPLPVSEATHPQIPSISVTNSSGTKYDRTVLPPPVISVSGPPPIPSIQISNVPPVPSISVNEVPTISINAPTISVQPSSISVEPPSISVSAPPSISINGAPSAPSTRPLPTPSSARPPPRHAATAPAVNTRGHWTPIGARSSALCAQCALPISGRIVSAAGARFHPECFRCNHCGEGLECVAFFPEPDNARAERLARVDARMRGEDVADSSERYDGDDSLRFYCHLDFHEFFSPRCKSCKTPIEGEVVVACGAEWHVGHFFCAQCGDPFDAQTPFVEKDGYAWCINCHTNRYSTKCRKCKKPVTDTVVKALGAEWHEECFCCVECQGSFTDGRYFLRPGGTDPYCPVCEEKRLKA